MDDRDTLADLLADIDPDLADDLRRGACGYYQLPVEIRAIVADRLDRATRRREDPCVHRGG
jgi:hypothetical protein